MLKIIAFMGKKESGKTLAADRLVTKFGFKKVNFKDALIAEVKEKFPETLNLIKDTKRKKNIDELFEKPYPEIIRKILQEYGTEVVRSEKPNHWVLKWKQAVDWVDGNSIVVDDIRYENEYNVVKELGGTVVRILRHNHVIQDKHSSENSADNLKADIEINNVGKKDFYLKKIDGLIE